MIMCVFLLDFFVVLPFYCMDVALLCRITSENLLKLTMWSKTFTLLWLRFLKIIVQISGHNIQIDSCRLEKVQKKKIVLDLPSSIALKHNIIPFVLDTFAVVLLLLTFSSFKVWFCFVVATAKKLDSELWFILFHIFLYISEKITKMV